MSAAIPTLALLKIVCLTTKTVWGTVEHHQSITFVELIEFYVRNQVFSSSIFMLSIQYGKRLEEMGQKMQPE
jgi:hypothetical protein